MATSSRHVGVTWNTQRRMWMARISVFARNRFLGYFSSEWDAKEACDEGRRAHPRYAYEKPRPKPPKRKTVNHAAHKEPPYGPLQIAASVRGYIVLQGEHRHPRDRWTPLVSCWLEHALEQDGGDDIKALMVVAIRGLRAEQDPPSTDYQLELERATEEALDALFREAGLAPLFAVEIDDE